MSVSTRKSLCGRSPDRHRLPHASTPKRDCTSLIHIARKTTTCTAYDPYGQCETLEYRVSTIKPVLTRNTSRGKQSFIPGSSLWISGRRTASTTYHLKYHGKRPLISRSTRTSALHGCAFFVRLSFPVDGSAKSCHLVREGRSLFKRVIFHLCRKNRPLCYRGASHHLFHTR